MQTGTFIHPNSVSQTQVAQAMPMENPDKAAAKHEAVLLTQALQTARQAPDIREEKIMELKKQLENGTYKIDSTAIAMSILYEEPGLFLRERA